MIYLLALYAGVVGLCVGSFLNLLADRLPLGESVLWGRSHCDHCKRHLSWLELIPLFSFLWQQGKCRSCHKKLSWEYPAIELVTGILYGFLVWKFFFIDPLYCASLLISCSALLVIFVADLKYYVIPDSMIVVAFCGAILSLLHASPAVIVSHGLSGVIAFGFFYFLWISTKKKGMGFGDVKFALFMGFFLGFPQIITALYVAFLTGAAVGIILIIQYKKKLKSRLPFGPFLILGFVVALFVSLPKFIGL